jgi:hypothetical protein
MSKAALTERVNKLNLQKGDIVVVKDEVCLHSLEALGRVVNFTVPLVFAPQGIQKLCRQDLLNLLEQLDGADKSVLPEYGITEQPSAPL